MRKHATYIHQSQFFEMTKSVERQVKLSELLDTNVVPAKKSYDASSMIQYIDISSIDNISKVFSQSVEYEYAKAPSRAQQCVKFGDILYSTVRPNLRNYGWLTINSNNLVASSGFCVLRPKENLEYYVFSIIDSDSFTKRMIDKAQGGVFPAVNQSFILDQMVPMPDDRTIALISSIYRQADKSKFDGFKSQFLEMFGNPVTNPKCWPSEQIKDVAPESPAQIKPIGKTWLLNLDMIEPQTGEIIEKVYEEAKDTLSVQPFDSGNVLFSKLRPYLNKVVAPDETGMATTELVPLRPKVSKLNKIFLVNLLRSNQFVSFANEISGGTKMPRMPLSELRKFKCILPPMELQTRFEAIYRQADKSKYYELN